MKKKAYLAFSLCLVLLMTFTVFATARSDSSVPDSFSILSSAEPMVKGGLRGQPIVFSKIDFAQALGISDIEAISITRLPDSRDGVLKLSNMKVGIGQTIRAEYLHLLTFVPTDKEVQTASFEFTSGDYACGSVLTCEIRIAEKINQAPTVLMTASSDLTTQKGISVYGNLIGEDPENDELTYIITDYPKGGTVHFTDARTGKFCYTPKEDFCGKDGFSYVVRDTYGNYSEENKVTIKIKERKVNLDYEDMTGNYAYNAALTATANRWMMGTLSGDGMYFDPSGSISRGDFVAMAMKAAGISPIENLTDSCFDDNEDIPTSVRSYVATAQQLGYVIGSFDGDGLNFHASRPVTRAEAAVIVNRILKLGTPASAPIFSDGDSIPVWAKKDIEALFDAGVMSATDIGIAAKAELSRADAAVMLVEISKID